MQEEILRMPGLIDFIQGNCDITTLLISALSSVVFVAVVAGLLTGASSLARSLMNSLFTSMFGYKAATLIQFYLTWPGTVFHELSHAFFGFVTGAKVLKIRLTPRFDAATGGYILGSVDFALQGGPLRKSIQSTFTAIAPVVTATVAVLLTVLFVFPSLHEWWQWLICIYLLVCVFMHSEMSTQDIKNLLRGLPVVLLIMFVVFLLVPIDIPYFLSMFENL